MDIKSIKVGELRTNCYIVSDDKETMVIDPGFEVDKILQEIAGRKVKAIILTHGHYDHVTGAFELKQKVNAPVWIGEKDEIMMSHSTQNLADRRLNDGDKFDLGHSVFQVISTPGHTSGGICLYNEKEKVLFAGDTLFAGDYGRTDLPNGSEREMVVSLNKLLKLPPETGVFPGHGYSTTIGNEQNLLQ